MTDKFAAYQSTEEAQREVSEYVHANFKLIMTKMASEMRRKLNMTADMQNSDGYLSLMVSLQGRMFNEMVYSLAGYCQSLKMKADQILPPATIVMFLNMLKGENPLKGLPRHDVKNDLAGFQKYYLEEIDNLRMNYEALPK
jgi:hypothetical protein